MTQDHNKKSSRQFQCRDYLWDIFEQMGAELECSTDYLINEAMRQYARSRNWGSRVNAPGVPAMAPPVAASVGGAQRANIGGAPPPMPPGSSGRVPMHTPGLGAPRVPSGSGSFGSRGNTIPPPLPGGGGGQQQQAAARADMPSLFVIFNGQKLPVNKEEFVIGRGSKTADLPIKDGNISRRHAAIVFQNGGFYMKDLGSTNGIEFDGERVDSRLIQEGDVYQLCDYELRFTYR